MKTFKMIRTKDESKVSGTGIVLEGVVFSNNKVVVHWYGNNQSLNIFDSFSEFEKIHILSHPTNGTIIYFSDNTITKY